MRFSEAWLRQWVNPEIDTQTLADQLSMAGLEVDAIEPAGADFSGVVVGFVRAVDEHPDATKLHVCTVDVGGDEPLQIVCGAANVAPDMKVPVATVGAHLPGGMKIKKAKLRGVASFGMICSASELGLAETSSGILPLPADAPLGEDFRAWLQLDDSCIEVDLTPDRGDCLSIAGIAREVAVINRAPLTVPEIEPVTPTCEDQVPVELLAPEACPRYLCRVVRNIDPAASTPMWMQEHLRRGGIRSIAPVVDVTNYVLLELGQPLHGFDLRQIAGGIRVRMAEPGERLQLLNETEVEVREDTLVIADHNRALALAGIMGGEGSGVSADTTDVLFESAFFAPVTISGKARSYGLHTDASHRYERGVDPQLQRRAIERATRLLQQIAGGEAGPVVEAVNEEHLPRPQTLKLQRRNVSAVLGMELADTEIVDILERLGMQVASIEDGWQVTPPSSRFDVVEEVDLIAELGRIHGYERIPMAHASSAAITKVAPEASFDFDRARLGLVSRGYQEVITYSFVSPEQQAMIDPDLKPICLANPISREMSAMRTSLWPGLLQAIQYNQARQQTRVRIFESGLRFRQGADGELEQRRMLAGASIGTLEAEQWGGAAHTVDFFDLKADVEALLSLTGTPGQFSFVPAEHSALHPGQSARIERNGELVGWIGMLHPALTEQLDLDGNAFLFELDLALLAEGHLPAYQSISRFPSIRRDLAIVVAETVTFAEISNCVHAAIGDDDLLRDLILFDVYAGKNIESGRKSLALGLILQASSQTLTDEVIEALIARVIERLASELGARLRD